MTMSSAKSKSVSLPGEQLIPYCGYFLVIKSITIRNMNGERMQPCLTLVMMSNMSEWPSLVRTQHRLLVYTTEI